MLTIGVEEEFLLLESDGAVAPAAGDVARIAGADDQIKPEYMAYQVETVTGVCTRLDQLRTEVAQLRLLAARSAEHAGVRLLATGAAPFAAGRLDALTDNARYRNLAQRFPHATAAGGTCACHVHVGIPDRNLAAEVITQMRPWLSTLLAITANSPFTGGVDSGWASCRYRAQLRWPTFRPPGSWTTADRYDRAVDSVISSGAAIDSAGVYFLARLSARYPTVEIRVADACLTIDDTVMFAGVVRTLIASLIDDIRRGIPAMPVSSRTVGANLLAAARHGVHPPAAGLPGGTGCAVRRLLAKITPWLDDAGDGPEIRAGLERIRRLGNGAERQRRVWTRTGTAEAFVASLADVTVPVV